MSLRLGQADRTCDVCHHRVPDVIILLLPTVEGWSKGEEVVMVGVLCPECLAKEYPEVAKRLIQSLTKKS